jgi:hypothetical protein
MKKAKILFASGMNETKAAKVLADVKKNLIDRGICDPEITYVNVLENPDLSSYEADYDFAIAAGQTITTTLPVIDGRNLVYSFLGTGGVYQDIEAAVKEL